MNQRVFEKKNKKLRFFNKSPLALAERSSEYFDLSHGKRTKT